MRLSYAACAAALCGATVTLAPAARAQPAADLARAEKDFEQALADERAGAYEKAAEALTEARALAHKETPQLLFHLGVCHAKLGKAVLARDELQRAAAGAKAQGLSNVATTAEAQLAEVQPRIASLALTAPARWRVTAVTVDGTAVSAKLGTGMDLDPGEHRVHVTFDGAPAADLNVTLGEGERRALPIPEPAIAQAPAPVSSPASAPTPTPASSPPPPPPPDASASPSSSSRTVGWVLVGGGAALLAGGAVLWALRGNDIGTLSNDCKTPQTCPASDQSVIDRGKLEDALGIGLFAAGGVAAAAGAAFLLFGGSHAAQTTGVRVTPLFTARGAGVGISGGLW